MNRVAGLTLVLAAATASAAHAQQTSDPSLAPLRAAAAAAAAAEMTLQAQTCVTGGMREVIRCEVAAAQKSEENLKDYRSALRGLLQARANAFRPGMLQQFDAEEAAWDTYLRQTAAAMYDLANMMGDDDSEESTRLKLIPRHIQDLDSLYYVMLHTDCGACLTDH